VSNRLKLATHKFNAKNNHQKISSVATQPGPFQSLQLTVHYFSHLFSPISALSCSGSGISTLYLLLIIYNLSKF